MPIRDKFIIFSTLLTTVLFGVFTVVHLSYTADRAFSDFKDQNFGELQSGDSFGIASRLNALLSNGMYRCVVAKKNGTTIYSHSMKNCGWSIFDGARALSPDGNNDISLTMIVVTPRYVKGFVLAILISLFLLITLTFRRYQRIQDENNLFYREVFDLARRTAHDIRSPLSAIQMVAEKYSKTDNEHGQLLQSASKRLTGIATTLLSRSRTYHNVFIGSNMTFDSISKENLKNLAEEVLREKTLEHPNHQFLFVCDQIENTMSVRGDKIELERVLSNLVNNSVESLPPIGGKVTVALRSYSSNSVIMEIKDNGIGMSKTQLFRLGQIIRQTNKKGSTGIGVFFAKKILKSWGGDLKFQSKLNFGTTASIILMSI